MTIRSSPGTPVAFRAVSIPIVLAQSAAWHWFSGRPSRRNLFFSVHVQPGFVDSDAGRAILRSFRLRVWLWAVAVSTIVVIAPGSDLSDLGTSYLLLGAMVAVMLGCPSAFSMAYSKTGGEATRLSEPSTQTASLSVDEDQTTAWLTLLDWLGILLPVGLPLATGIFLGPYSGSLEECPVALWQLNREAGHASPGTECHGDVRRGNSPLPEPCGCWF